MRPVPGSLFRGLLIRVVFLKCVDDDGGSDSDSGEGTKHYPVTIALLVPVLSRWIWSRMLCVTVRAESITLQVLGFTHFFENQVLAMFIFDIYSKICWDEEGCVRCVVPLRP